MNESDNIEHSIFLRDLICGDGAWEERAKHMVAGMATKLPFLVLFWFFPCLFVCLLVCLFACWFVCFGSLRQNSCQEMQPICWTLLDGDALIWMILMPSLMILVMTID